ncbi:hypothetical protein MMC28_005388 [Mycoblastus sanguinarius]|nr:hypothetical protein [Mycoblastus sanguinarius]
MCFFQAPKRGEVAQLSFRQKVDQLDIIGTLVFLPAVICLLLGLQWGGSKYAWSNAKVIVLLIFAGVLATAFVGIQIWKQEKATVPPRIIKQRSIAFGAWYSFWLGAVYFLLIYYVSLLVVLVRVCHQLCIGPLLTAEMQLPIWFQAIKGVSATTSGVMNLPLIMAHVISALLAGGLITMLGYYTPFMIISSILVSIGTGLLTTWKVDTGHAMWIGYQATCGLGSGLGMNQPLMAAQTVLALDDVSIGTASVIFSQTLGGAIFISAGQTIFTNTLLSNIHVAVPQLDPAIVLATGATEVKSAVRPDLIEAVTVAYNGALVRIFYLAVSLACLTILGSMGMEWRSVKENSGVAGILELPGVEMDERRTRVSASKS